LAVTSFFLTFFLSFKTDTNLLLLPPDSFVFRIWALQPFSFGFTIISNYSTSLFLSIRSGFEPAVTSIFSAFSLSSKTATVLQSSWLDLLGLSALLHFA
jgi:hypothetical protein